MRAWAQNVTSPVFLLCMLKKVRLDQLQVGMYIHTLCGSWFSHPFWRTAFLIESPETLHKLQACPIEAVWIDTERGLDPDVPIVQPRQASVPLRQELQRAQAICAQARETVMQMFQDARLGQALRLGAAEDLVHEVMGSIERHPDALISVARLKTMDNYTYMHSVAVCGLMVALGQRMQLPQAQIHQAGLAGLLHDVGKAQTDLGILNKPGKLTDEEFAHMKQHPVKGHAMLQGHVDDDVVLHACLHHHERIDGKGYPHGLAGDELPLITRMTSICDVYDAITSDRPYKRGWPPSTSLQRMSEWCGTHLDAAIFEEFVKTIGIYPLGSLVRLESGLLAVVCAPPSAQASLSSPQVMAFYHVADKRMLRPAKLMDLNQLPHERIVSREDPANWPFTSLDSLWQKAARAMA